MNNKLTIAIFMTLLFALTLVNLFSPVRAYSDHENRYLAQMPEFSFKAVFDGSFTSDFEAAVTDQFVVRDTWVSAKTLSEYMLGKGDNNGVYFARDGYLIEEFISYDADQYAKNLGYVATFTQALNEADIPVDTMLVPSASRILADKLRHPNPELDQAALLDEARAAGLKLVDVSPALAAAGDQYIYYRTDHHWTTPGAYLAYAAWQNITPAPDTYTHERLSDAFYGTTYTKAGLVGTKADEMEAWWRDVPLHVEYNLGQSQADSLYAREYLEVKDKYSTFLNGNQAVTKITGGPQNGKKLLIIKDSYANSFAQFPVYDYEEVHLLDLRSFKTSPAQYARDNGITQALVLYSLKGFAAATELYVLAQG